MTANNLIWPVILSGGAGTRLWPMSRESYPKQFLPLTGAQSLLQEAAKRVGDRSLFHQPLIVCNAEHRFMVAQQLQEADCPPSAILLEPFGRNTAPAVAMAAHDLLDRDPDAIMLVLPSDHVIRDQAAFFAAVDTARAAAEQGMLTTFGITPDEPETGFGYIERGAPLKDIKGCFEIAAFVEKPDQPTAESYVKAGKYDWNSGMFLFRAAQYLETLSELDHNMAECCAAAHAAGQADLDFIRINPEEFEKCPSNSIDYAVMERATQRAVVPTEMGWSDVGSWSALLDIATPDGAGNVVSGEVISLENSNSYLRSEGPVLATLGIEDMIVVATKDAVLVLAKDRAQDVKTIVDAMKTREMEEAVAHPRVYRPWGYYETIDSCTRFQVKRITLNVGAAISLQKHMHRAEHWVVVSGTAKVRRGDDELFLHENESTYIPPNTVHRLENPGKLPLSLIEVQSGSYLGEDDIIRLEDTYGRE